MSARRRPHIVMCARIVAPGVGGAETQIRALAEALSEHFRVTLLACLPPPPSAGKPRSAGSQTGEMEIRAVSSTSGRLDRLLGPRRVVEECQRLAPDLIYARYVSVNLALAKARRHRRLECPVVLQEVTIPSVYYRGTPTLAWTGYRMRSDYRHADLVLTNASMVLEDLVGNFRVSPERCSYLPNLAPVLASPAPSQEPAGERVELVAVSRLVEGKGYEDLLGAYAVARRRTTVPSRLTLVGDGPLRGTLEELAADLELADSIVFAGRVEDPGPVYARSHLFVHPSHFEGMSNAIMEAMAHGLAILATDVGAARDLIPSEDQGWIVPSKNPDALADALSALIGDPSRRRRLATAARERIGSFSAEVVAPRYAEIFRRLMACGALPQPDEVA